jgi:hypothetical protein
LLRHRLFSYGSIDHVDQMRRVFVLFIAVLS